MAELPLYTPPPGALPRFARVRQIVDERHVGDVGAAVARALAPHAARFRPGERVAITAGSRGIAQIAQITAALAAELRRVGAEPFVVPAMGSHGGATAEGQRAVLASLGMTEELLGCPIVATMETAALGVAEGGVAVHCDAAAAGADAIVLLNRVKPHSILRGELGSGLMKIAAVGLGNHRGASAIHAAGLEQHLLPVARAVLARAPVRLGLAIVENARGQVRTIEAAAPEAIEAADRRLLAEARALLPQLPLEPLDLLIVERIGKQISGTGMDPNVIGMHRRMGGAPDRQIERIVALALDPASQGNANGVGMADIITGALRDAIDWRSTWANALTADFLEGVRLPIACPTARDALLLALRGRDPRGVRAAQIRDTAHLEELLVSEALLPEVAASPRLELVGELAEWPERGL